MRRARFPEHTEETLHDTMVSFFQTRGCRDEEMKNDMRNAEAGLSKPITQVTQTEATPDMGGGEPDRQILVTDADEVRADPDL